MSSKNRKKWIGVRENELLGLLTGKYKMKLPDDAEIIHVRSTVYLDLIEFLVMSETYPELSMGSAIPTECETLIIKEGAK